MAQLSSPGEFRQTGDKLVRLRPRRVAGPVRRSATNRCGHNGQWRLDQAVAAARHDALVSHLRGGDQPDICGARRLSAHRRQVVGRGEYSVGDEGKRRALAQLNGLSQPFNAGRPID